MAAFQRHFLVYFILGMPPEISVHSEPGGRSKGGESGALHVAVLLRETPQLFRTSHTEPVSVNDEGEAPHTQTKAQKQTHWFGTCVNLYNTACALH